MTMTERKSEIIQIRATKTEKQSYDRSRALGFSVDSALFMALAKSTLQDFEAKMKLSVNRHILSLTEEAFEDAMFRYSLSGNTLKHFSQQAETVQEAMFEAWKQKKIQEISKPGHLVEMIAKKKGVTPWQKYVQMFEQMLIQETNRLHKILTLSEDTREFETESNFCPYCDGKFPSKAKLKAHVKTEHPEQYDAMYRAGRRVG